MLPADTQLVPTLDALHQLGFFAAHAGVEGPALLHRIRSYYGLDWPEVMAEVRTRAALDQLLVLVDDTRVWCRDLECLYPGAEAYASALQEWAAISRGIFQPADVAERWQSPAGPVELTWTANGRRFTFTHRDGHDDFLRHLDLLALVNQGLTDRAYRFVACDDYPGDCRLVTVLHFSEQEQLQRQRGWSFCQIRTP